MSALAPAWPPMTSRSTTIVSSPSEAAHTAAARPAGPAPAIARSHERSSGPFAPSASMISAFVGSTSDVLHIPERIQRGARRQVGRDAVVAAEAARERVDGRRPPVWGRGRAAERSDRPETSRRRVAARYSRAFNETSVWSTPVNATRAAAETAGFDAARDRKSTRLNSSHGSIWYA